MSKRPDHLRELFGVLATLGTCVLTSACAAVVNEPSEPLQDEPLRDESHAPVTVPHRDADADVPDPTEDPARYEPLAVLDTSQDGVIDERELGITSDEAFTAFDADDDERLDADELRAGAAASGTTPDELDDAVTIMTRWDRDGDGAVERTEFVTGRMLLLDVDRDARVSSDEWNSQSWQHRYGLPLDGEEHPGY